MVSTHGFVCCSGGAAWYGTSIGTVDAIGCQLYLGGCVAEVLRPRCLGRNLMPVSLGICIRPCVVAFYVLACGMLLVRGRISFADPAVLNMLKEDIRRAN
eukprot:6462762-Amphidinium_carterae.1